MSLWGVILCCGPFKPFEFCSNRSQRKILRQSTYFSREKTKKTAKTAKKTTSGHCDHGTVTVRAGLDLIVLYVHGLNNSVGGQQSYIHSVMKLTTLTTHHCSHMKVVNLQAGYSTIARDPLRVPRRVRYQSLLTNLPCASTMMSETAPTGAVSRYARFAPVLTEA